MRKQRLKYQVLDAEHTMWTIRATSLLAAVLVVERHARVIWAG